jgi:DNA-binding transcriptional regulator YhcF (GntR family)
VDVRTVAGRLGHSGGGVTTLRTYAAWVSEADQRATGGISARMPSRPEELTALERARIDPRSPYEVVAADLADQVRQGALPPGDLVPAAEDLAVQYGVAVSTARRAVGLLVQWELALRVGSGRARVRADTASALSEPAAPQTSSRAKSQLWSVVVRGPGGTSSAPRLVSGSLSDPDSFRAHLVGMTRLEAKAPLPADERWVVQYELEVHQLEGGAPTAVLRWSS